MAENEDQKIKITFDTNAGKAAQDTSKLGASIDKVEKSTKGATKATKENSGSLEDMGGAVGGAVGAMKSMLKTMWAIVANPLGLVLVAIVGALTLLFKAFTSTNDGADKLEQTMAGLGAVVDVLRDRFLKMVTAIGKFMTGDFKGAMEVGKEAVQGLGEEMAREAQNAANYTRALQEVADATRDLGVSRAKLNRDLAAAKELITDENASFKDKKKAIDAIRIAEGSQTDQELSNAKKKLAAIDAQNIQSDTSDADLQKRADAQSAVFKLEEEQASNKRAFNKLEKRASADEQSRLKTIADARKAELKELADKKKEADKLALDAQKVLDDQFKALAKEKADAERALLLFNQDLADKTEEQKLARQKERALQEIEILKQKGIDVENLLISNAEKFATLENELIQKRADEQRVIDEKIAADKLVSDEKIIAEQKRIDDLILAQAQSIQDSKLQIADRAVGFLSMIAGKNKALQRAAIVIENALGIGKSLIANSAANVAATSAGAALAIPTAGASVAAAAGLVVQNNISTGIGIATSIAATAKALSALGGGGGISGGGGVESMGGSRTSARPSVAFNNTAENQIGQSVAKVQTEQPPLRVYVSESDITDAQKNVKVLLSANEF